MPRTVLSRWGNGNGEAVIWNEWLRIGILFVRAGA
jgi:hypothetical protein